MNRRVKRRGFSLIEVILAIVVLSASFLGLVYALSNTTLHNIDLDISTTAILLAREKMSETTAKPFANVVGVSTTGFGGDFSDYSYEVEVDYVDASDLDTAVVGPTEYKRITVTITSAGWAGNIELFNLKANL